jgi:hypothetical protein
LLTRARGLDFFRRKRLRLLSRSCACSACTGSPATRSGAEYVYFVVTGNSGGPEELQKELDGLITEQYEDFAEAIYLGMPPEKVRRMDARFARIEAISEELRLRN